MHLLECVDCVDEEKTKWATHTRVKMSQIEEYHFNPSRISGSTLFKLPKLVIPLTVTGLVDAQYEFRSIVEREGLTGLKFEELWSDSR
jgi:hypothetical protein